MGSAIFWSVVGILIYFGRKSFYSDRAQKTGRTKTKHARTEARQPPVQAPPRPVINTEKLSADEREVADWIDQSYGVGAAQILMTIKNSKKLYVPAVGMVDSLAQLKDHEYGSIKSSDLSYGIHMVEFPLNDGRSVEQAAAYSAITVLNNQEFIQECDAQTWFEQMLYYAESDGIALNPKTRFMNPDYSGMSLTINRFALAEIIGFLMANDTPADLPFYELANRSFQQGRPYEVLYYWGRSYRSPRGPDDQWQLAEASKLRCYFNLNFPGSKDRARSELQWMITTHPAVGLRNLSGEFAY